MVTPQHGRQGDPVWLPEVLKAFGVQVREMNGWRDHGQGDFTNIDGIICHHTAGANTSAEYIARNPGIGNGLSSQMHLGRDGVITLCGAGIAWHAGEATQPQWLVGYEPRKSNGGIEYFTKANAVMLGIEAVNAGDGSQPWPEIQMDSYARSCAAICWYLGLPVSRVLGHKEMAPSRKADPNFGMDNFRKRVQHYVTNPPFQGGKPLPGATSAPSAAVFHPMRNEHYSVSSPYGMRSGSMHKGTDFAAAHGTPIYAVADGVIVQGKDRAQGTVDGFGSWIWLDCQDSVGRDFIYGHVHYPGILVTAGQRVIAGQKIGVVGNEGESSGPHLHFEVWTPPGKVGGSAENPQQWLDKNINNGNFQGGVSMALLEGVSAAALNDAKLAAIDSRKNTERILAKVDELTKKIDTMSDQLIGWKKDQSGKPLFHGFPQGGDRTLYNLIAAIAEHTGVPNTFDTKAEVKK